MVRGRECKRTEAYSYFQIAVPAIVVVGLFGNAMALLLIWSKDSLKGLASNVYLCGLAALSSIFLVTVALSWLEGFSLHLPLFGANQAACKSLTFLAHLADLGCVWFIVLTCLDRFLLLFFPELRRALCSAIVARSLCLLILLLGAICESWILALAVSQDGVCTTRHSQLHLFTLFNTLESILTFFLPASLILALNCAVVLRVRRYAHFGKAVGIGQATALSRRKSRDAEIATLSLSSFRTRTSSLLPTSVASPTGVQLDIPPLLLTPTLDDCDATPRHEIVEFISSMPATLRYTRRRSICMEDILLTKRLLLLTAVFILLNAPNHIVRLTGHLVSDPNLAAALYLLSYLSFYAHHGILFFVYIFNSPQMRKELRPTALKVLECWCMKNAPDFGH